MTKPALMPVMHPNRLNRGRAIMTNDPRRLNGIDMRTSAGRRYRDIVDQIAAEFGPINPIALRELAGLRYTLEQTQAAVAASDARALRPRQGLELDCAPRAIPEGSQARIACLNASEPARTPRRPLRARRKRRDAVTSIIDAMTDGDCFGPWFEGDSWDA
jgi:hypothetical protein